MTRTVNIAGVVFALPPWACYVVVLPDEELWKALGPPMRRARTTMATIATTMSPRIPAPQIKIPRIYRTVTGLVLLPRNAKRAPKIRSIPENIQKRLTAINPTTPVTSWITAEALG